MVYNPIKCKDLIKFIQENNMEDKPIFALCCKRGFVWSASFDKFELSCPEDGCVFLRIILDEDKEPDC